eukprot:GHVT01008538.1.p2 GENE.GHVT01008538.1~~GHVT01008538.1.p2  ORF type:complete len:235 (-),score=21.28 GHVT01008538.1:907-1611(-)
MQAVGNFSTKCRTAARIGGRAAHEATGAAAQRTVPQRRSHNFFLCALKRESARLELGTRITRVFARTKMFRPLLVASSSDVTPIRPKWISVGKSKEFFSSIARGNLKRIHRGASAFCAWRFCIGTCDAASAPTHLPTGRTRNSQRPRANSAHCWAIAPPEQRTAKTLGPTTPTVSNVAMRPPEIRLVCEAMPPFSLYKTPLSVELLSAANQKLEHGVGKCLLMLQSRTRLNRTN